MSMSEPKYAGKNRTLAIVLAIFLGIVGAHKFYLGNWKYGLLYLVFCWTGVPILLGFYDAFRYYQSPNHFTPGSISASNGEISDVSGKKRITQMLIVGS